MNISDMRVGQKVKVISTSGGWALSGMIGRVGEIIDILNFEGEDSFKKDPYISVGFFESIEWCHKDSGTKFHCWYYFRPKEIEVLSPFDPEFKQVETKKGTNPKDLLGVKKVSISKLPAAGVIHAAHAMMDGAGKYGPYNWRGNSVIASIYVDAAYRHLQAWFDSREECAEDSGVHHLGHAMACCAILLDAQETGNMVDDRPEGGKASEILKRLATKIKAKAEEKK